MVEFVRTPIDRFENLPNFSYEPHYIENLEDYDDLRMCFYDEGKKDSNRD